MSWRLRCFLKLTFVVALVGSLAFNGFLFVRGQGYYRQLSEVRLDPLGLSYHAATSDVEAVTSTLLPKVVFYGDSRAARWPSPELPVFLFLNRGVESQTSAQVALRLEHDLAPLKPQVVVVQVGVNDLKVLPLFPERRAAMIAACKNNIRQTVEDAVALDATVVLTTIFPTGKPSFVRRLLWSDQVQHAISETNVFIRSLAGSRVIVLDADKVLAGQDGRLNPAYAVDLLHVNEVGYRELNIVLAQTLTAWAQDGR